MSNVSLSSQRSKKCRENCTVENCDSRSDKDVNLFFHSFLQVNESFVYSENKWKNRQSKSLGKSNEGKNVLNNESVLFSHQFKKEDYNILPGLSCKEKWKNIRSCYTRHLRQKACDKAKKPYYLSKHLQFLLPFCRSITPLNIPPFSSPSQAILWNKIETTDDEPPDDPLTLDNKEDELDSDDGDNILISTVSTEELEKDTNDEITKPNEEEEVADVECSNSPPRRWRNRKRKLLFPSEKRGFDYPTAKKPNYTDCEDPDLNFFKSLLPDVHRMTSKQKNRLKIKILSEIDSILYPDESEH